MICSHCKTNHKSRDLNRWDIQLCADGRRRRVFYLCDPCDIDLNSIMLQMMGDKNAEVKAAKYAEKHNV